MVKSLTMSNSSSKKVKIVKVEQAIFIAGTEWMYVLAEDGKLYYGGHKPETNEITWQEVPPIQILSHALPQKRGIKKKRV